MAARRQFLNDPETLVAQALEGFERSNSDADRELAARLFADPPSLDGSWRAGRNRASRAARRRPTDHTRT